MKKSIKSMLNRLFINFFNGIAILMPVILTVWIIRFLVVKLNDIILEPLLKLFAGGASDVQHVLIAKAFILIMVICGVALIGWGARILVIRRSFAWGESILLRVPIMGRIYRSIKQISGAFLGQGKTIFKQVVLIEYPRKGIFSIGFTTGTTKGEVKTVAQDDGINVFIPTTPNPTSGMFIVVPRREVQFLRMNVEDGMKLVISGGSVTPASGEEQA